ncbi:MAG: xanthine dehydrogenase family protein subunit M [Deltaproteobacteria bacterium]|nr:xanthine dehydrogenase family protein subunit M [Deltaproteobacteria bacterium]
MLASRYEAPRSVQEAVALLAADAGAKVLAGGTDLLVQMRTGAGAPAAFVDIKRIPELMRIEVDGHGLRCGAAVPAAEICEHPTIRSLWPGLVEATDLIGSTQIQGRATWCGNLCNASPAADTVPALIAARAQVVITGPTGERTLAVEEVCTAPGRTVRANDELVTEFRVPSPAPRSSDAYLRLIPRSEMDIAVVGAGVSMTVDAGGIVTAARVALGAVAPTVLVVDGAARALVGSTLDDSALSAAAAAASEAANPIDDKRGTAAYRKQVAGVLTKRAARIAYERARERG